MSPSQTADFANNPQTTKREPPEEQGKGPQTIMPAVATLQALVTAVC